MEPENINLEAPQNEQPSSLHKVTPFSKYLAMALFILLPFVGGYVGYQYGSSEKGETIYVTENPDSQTNTPEPVEIVDNYFSSNEVNISFTYPPNWQMVSGAEENSFPLGVNDPLILLSEQESNCHIAVVDFDHSIESYKQSSFANRIYTTDFQFDGNWYVDQTVNKTPIEFTNERQFLDAEVRVSHSHGIPDFVLWNAKGTAVPLECERDFESLVATVAYYYEKISLDEASEGILTIKENYSRNKNTYRVLFTDQRSGETYSVADLPFEIRSAYIKNQKIYTWGQSLLVIDPFKGTYEELKIPALANTVVSSLYLKDNDVIILAYTRESSGCLDKFGDGCVGSLYSYDVVSGKLQTLSEAVPATHILGLSKDGQTLYFQGGFRDGGFRSLYLSSYTDGNIEKLYSGSTFADELGYNEIESQRQRVLDDIVPIFNNSGVKIAAGFITAVATSPVNDHQLFYFID